MEEDKRKNGLTPESDEALEERIRSAEVDIPESLSPENVEACLREKGEKLRRAEDKKKIVKLRKYLGAAAAVLAAAILIPTLIIVLGKNPGTEGNTQSKAAMREVTDSEAYTALAVENGLSEAEIEPQLTPGVLAGGSLEASEDISGELPEAVSGGTDIAGASLSEEARELIQRSEDAFAGKDGGKEGGEEASGLSLAAVLAKAGSYEEMARLISRYPSSYILYANDFAVREKGAAPDEYQAETAEAAPTQSSAEEHSTTNLREANVDEGDIVKTDGTFIYQLRDESYVRIVRAEAGKLEEVSLLKPDFGQGGQVLDMYLTGDRLILITRETVTELAREEEDDVFYLDEDYGTHVRTYELGDRTDPKETGNVTFEGRYETSRIADGVVYVITDKTENLYYPVRYLEGEPMVNEESSGWFEDILDWFAELFESSESSESGAARSPEAEDAEPYESSESGAVSSSKSPEAEDAEPYESSESGAVSGSKSPEAEDAIETIDGNELYSALNGAPETEEQTFSEEELLASGAVPKVNGKYLSVSDIYLPAGRRPSRSWLVGSVRLAEPDKAADAKLICTDLNEIYVSSNAIFLMGISEADYDGSNVIRVDFADGLIRPTGAAYLPGTVKDSFSVSENAAGYFRAAVTRGWNGTNSVYIFDQDMKLCGSLENIIDEEEIQSARYIGDMLYLVTYRNTDPLFCIDLTDPAKPRLLGELKIPGFSAYLHPYGENRLLGLGYETDPETGDTLGTKISLFDISDPANVKEISKLVLRNVEADQALANYKAILADPGKNLFGFAAEEAWWASNQEDDWVKWTDEEELEGIEEEAETAPEEDLARKEEAEGLIYTDGADKEGLVYAKDVAEGLVFEDGTTEAVSEDREKSGAETEESPSNGRTADVRMLGDYVYLLFSVENDQILCRLVRSLDDSDDYYGYENYLGCRGIYIGSTFYLVSGEITAFDLENEMKVIGSLA